MFKTKELEVKIKDLCYQVDLLKEEIKILNLKLADREFREELQAEENMLNSEKDKQEKIEKSFQNLFNYTESIATRGYDN